MARIWFGNATKAREKKFPGEKSTEEEIAVHTLPRKLPGRR
jgi:hypothetical protein